MPPTRQFDLQTGIEVLQRTPATLDALLRDLSDWWTRSNYGPETFSPFDVVGHLIHGEKTDWMPRIRRILESGESVPFDKFDRYAMYEASKSQTLAALLDEFAVLRQENLKALADLPLEQNLDRTGMHPVLGRVTLRNLLACWVAHDLNHVHQIAKCMSYQYREAVGPWEQFLGVYR